MRRWIESVLFDQEQGMAATSYRFAATLPSYLFKTAIKGRHLLYEMGLLEQKQLPLPVISIGNLVCGGTGKTQVALVLAQELMKKKRVAILARGYRGQLAESKQVDVSHMSAKECGDEPWLLASRLPDAIVIAGKKRVDSAQIAFEKGAELLLLDDGMQHRQVKRDREIVVVDGQNPFGGGHYLPCGPLRDDPKRLYSADMIISIGPFQGNIDSIPVVEMEIRPAGTYSLSGEKLSFTEKVGLFCGIGNPHRFVKTVTEMGCNVVDSHFFADHDPLQLEEIIALAKRAKAKGAQRLLCTEKDKVKLPADIQCLLPIGWVKSELKIVRNQEAWKTEMEKMVRL